MAISSANAPVSSDSWVQIATSTPTSGTVVSFTSIPTDYRKLWLVTAGPITLTASGQFGITINSLNATNDYRYFSQISSGHRFTDEPRIFSAAAGTSFNYNITFDNPSGSLPFVKFQGGIASSGSAGSTSEGWVVNATTAISRLDITSDTGDLTTNTGVFYLYGTY